MSTVAMRNGVDLQKEIVSKIVGLGSACATDLATQIGRGITAKELVDPLEDLVRSGVLRHKTDTGDPRKYSSPEQTAYELAR